MPVSADILPISTRHVDVVPFDRGTGYLARKLHSSLQQVDPQASASIAPPRPDGAAKAGSGSSLVGQPIPSTPLSAWGESVWVHLQHAAST